MAEINRYTLANGLRVAHMQDTSTAMVAVNVLYNVGSRDEDARTRGIAHLCEHMMFTGSPEVPDFDEALQDVGAVNNAWTSNDFTNYHEFAPASNLETLLWVESDRMRALNLTPRAFANQLSVVTEEFKETCLNQPYGDLQHHLRPLVYGSEHPYSTPVIGSSIEVLQGLTSADIARWHDKYYDPCNAVVAVCGNVDFATTRLLVDRWFASVPSHGAVTARMEHSVPATCAAEPLTVRGHVPQTLIALAWRMDPYGTTGWYAADCLSDVLASGRSSRLFRRVTMKSQLIVDADASITGSEDRGLFLVSGRLSDNSPEAADRAIATLTETAHALGGDEPATDIELQRAKNKYRSRFMFSNLDCASRAATLAMAEMHGEDYFTQVARYEGLSADDLRHTAATLFKDPPAILVYKPLD